MCVANWKCATNWRCAMVLVFIVLGLLVVAVLVVAVLFVAGALAFALEVLHVLTHILIYAIILLAVVQFIKWLFKSRH